ncbi:MAG: 5-(carboxyamino)imidazole ribonucleotide mutase [Candidatus Brockarchaeota archaeon]|nr:5-(carboxyamino)imidazole ribonucleotide mutase [Candidatus Brockarchaeota archaeon]
MKVSVIVGSRSDMPVAEDALKVLKDFGIECEAKVLSAHRDPEALDDYVKSQDADVFIAIAGLSAALPGYVASRTTKPVIGVPREAKLQGLDSLLSMVQMPTGVPVACVGIDNAKNAALLAVEILAVKDGRLKGLLEEHRKKMREPQQ